MKIFQKTMLVAGAAMMTLAALPAEAQKYKGGGGGGGANRPAGAGNGGNKSANVSAANNRQVRSVSNSSVNRNVNVNNKNYNNSRPGNNYNNRPGQRPDVVVVNGGGRPPAYGYNNGYNNGYYNNNGNWDNNDNDVGDFILKTAAVTAGVAAVTAVAKSGNNKNTTNVNGQECQQQISNGQVYVNCNGTWYQPVQNGTQTNYQTISGPPR